MQDKVCVVTGAGGGIGRATAVEMVRRGASVVVSDISETGGLETVELARKEGGEAAFVRADVTSTPEVEELMRRAHGLFGRIDVLHNNAGVHETALTDRPAAAELPEEVWDRVLDINLKGSWRCARAAFPYLREHGGSIVNAGSVGSFVGYPMASAYCSSKGAVLQLTRALATEWAPFGIRVNCYCPGNVETPMISGYWDAATDPAAVKRELGSVALLDRLAAAEEIARVVVFLASDESSFVNGSVLTVDGGTLAWRGIN